MARKKIETGPDIYTIRKEQAEKALEIAKVVNPNVFIGELDDREFYLVIKTEINALVIQQKLDEEGIQGTLEKRPLSDDFALYLLDEVENEDDEDDSEE